MKPYDVELSPGAVRAFKKLPEKTRQRIRSALEALARDAAGVERVGGKQVKTLQGTQDKFHRLRVGEHRVMYDLIPEDRVLLVLGIVARKDLERWLRTR